VIAFNTDVRLKKGPPRGVLGIILITFLIHVFFTSLQEMGAITLNERWDLQAFHLESPDPLQALFSILSHADYLHWFFNMLYLWIFGSILEDRLGWARFLGLFFLCGACAEIIHYVVVLTVLALAGVDVPAMRSLGASGAVSGIMGLAMFRFHRARVRVWLDWTGMVPLLRWSIPIGFFCAWFFIKQIFGLLFSTGSTNYLAHIGGFLGGMLAGPLLGFKKQSREEILWEKALTLKEQGMFAQAAEEFIALLPGRSEDPVIHREIGDCLQRAGRLGRRSKEETRAEAFSYFRRAIDLHVHRGEKAEAVELYSGMLGPLGDLITPDLRERMSLLAVKGYGNVSNAIRDPLVRRAALEAAVREKWNCGDTGGAYAVLVEMAGLEGMGQWPPIVLSLGAETALRAKDIGLAEKLFEQLALKGDEKQTLRALQYLSKGWLKTPQQRRLVDLYRSSRERHANIDLVPEWVELGLKLKQ
jgi:membrane associated rhomboid family serine protease